MVAETIQTTAGFVDRREFSAWMHSFQGANVSWKADERMMMGNFFLGLQAWNAAIFVGTDIPPGAKILSATATYVTQQTGIGDPIVIQLNTPFRGETYGSIPLRNVFGTRQWRQQFWVANELLLRNPSGNSMGISPVVLASPDNAWALWQENSTAVGLSGPENTTAMRQRFGTKTTIVNPAGGGGFVLDTCRTILSQNGSITPGTNLFIDITPAKVTFGGVVLPDDDNILATSDPLPATDVGATNAHDFFFTGDDRITLPLGEIRIAVLRADPEPVIDGFQFISQHSKSTFGQPTQHATYGAGVGWDYQNYPGTADLATAIVNPNNDMADTVLWSPAINPIVGSTHTTPDISQIVQAQVDHPSYEAGGRVLILTQYGQGQSPQNRVWASFNSLSQDPPRIDVTWQEQAGGGVGHGAIILDPYEPRIEKGRDMSDDQLALLAVTVIEEFE